MLRKKKIKRKPSHCISTIQELKSLGLALTTKNKKKIKENKDWVTNEVEHIDVTVKKLTLNIQKNKILHPDRIQPVEQNLASRKTPDATTQSIREQNSKITVTQPKNHTHPNANENQGYVYIVMDCNVENPNGSITAISCKNVNSAESILKSPKTVNLIKILLHIDVNDIDEEHPEDLAFNLRDLTERFHRKVKHSYQTLHVERNIMKDMSVL